MTDTNYPLFDRIFAEGTIDPIILFHIKTSTGKTIAELSEDNCHEILTLGKQLRAQYPDETERPPEVKARIEDAWLVEGLVRGHLVIPDRDPEEPVLCDVGSAP